MGLHHVRRQIALVVRKPKPGGPFRHVETELAAQTEAYVCTECGLHEEYVLNASQIPWDEVEGSRC